MTAGAKPLAGTEGLTVLRDALIPDLVQAEEARLILSWYQNGSIVTPDERSASFVREVLQQVGVEIDVLAEPPDDPTPTPPTPEQPPKPTASEPAKTPETAQKRSSKLSAAALSRAAKAWADKHPDEAAALIYYNATAGIELIAPDARRSKQGSFLALLLSRVACTEPADLPELLDPLSPIQDVAIAQLTSDDDHGALPWPGTPAEALFVAVRLPAISEHDIDGEPISVLAAARKLFAPWRTATSLPIAPQATSRRRLPNNHLPELPPATASQLVLPAMPRTAQTTTAPWIALFDSLGGNSMAKGRGAPLELRLWIEALAWATPAARNGHLINVPMTLRQLRDALWPHGWHRGRQLPRLRDAMRRINSLGFLQITRDHEWAPILWRTLPTPGAGLDATMLLQVQLPPVERAGLGAPFNRNILRRLGLTAAPQYRAYLGLVELWDRTRRRGYKPWQPATDRPQLPWPNLQPHERRRLVFGDDSTVNTASTLRTRQQDADRAIQDLDAHGVIELRPDSDHPRKWQLVRRDLHR